MKKSARTIHVSVDGWQFQCCGELGAVGDAVEWRLLFLPESADGPGRPGGPGQPGEWHFFGEPLVLPHVRPKDAPTILRADGVTAYWRRSSRFARGWDLRGTLHEDHHGAVPGEVPPTRGRIRSITPLPGGEDLRVEIAVDPPA